MKMGSFIFSRYATVEGTVGFMKVLMVVLGIPTLVICLFFLIVFIEIIWTTPKGTLEYWLSPSTKRKARGLSINPESKKIRLGS